MRSNHRLPALRFWKETRRWRQEVYFCRGSLTFWNDSLTRYCSKADVKLPIALQALAIFASSKISTGCKCLQLPTPTVTSVVRATITTTSTGMNAFISSERPSAYLVGVQGPRMLQLMPPQRRHPAPLRSRRARL